MTATARRALAELLVSSPDGKSTLARIPGERMAGLRWSTAVNFGCRALSFRLLGRDLSEYIPDEEAVELRNQWRFARMLLTVSGEWAWEGEAAELIPVDPIFDLAAGRLIHFDVTCRGLYALYQRVPPALDYPSDDDEEVTVSVTQLVIDATESLGGLIAQRYSHVLDTGVNVPVGTDDMKAWYDHIIDGCKAGDAKRSEPWFGVFKPEDGPYLQRMSPSDYKARASVVGSGLAMPWRAEEYVSAGQARWSDESEQQVTDRQDDPTGNAVRLHHGVIQERTISLDRVGASGAENGLLSYLTNHADPVGPIGSGQQGQVTYAPRAGDIWPPLTGRGGEPIPPWQLLAGDTLDLYDLHPSDRRLRDRRGVLVFSVETDLDAGSVAIQYDGRAIRSRRHERPSEIAVERSVQEPGVSGGLIVNQATAATYTLAVGNTILPVDGLGDAGVITFSVPNTRKYVVIIGSQWTPTGAGGVQLSIGWEMDSEGWSDSQHDRTASYNVDPASNNNVSVGRTFKARRITAGRQHAITVFVKGGSAGNSTLQSCTVQIRRP